jgi:5-methylcytosine-specific restriction endonuclease McrA
VVVADRCTVLAEYDQEIRSPSVSMRLPSVIACRDFIDPNRPAPLTRLNVLLVAGYRCGYCNQAFDRPEDLTFDHLVPQARGGVTSWRNIIAACHRCNQRKGCHTPAEARMRPQWTPRQPSIAEVNRLAQKYARRVVQVHATWLDFLYWDSDVAT